MSDEPRKVLSVQWVDAGFDLGGGDKADGPMTIVTVEGHIGSVGSGDTILYRRPTQEPPPAEVMRAWVARSESGALGAFAEKPTRLDSLSGVWWNGKATWLPSSWLPTLAPGECWPVEIRRITE